MIDVVCFCGCSYSFAGHAGVCPRCGELVTFPRARGNQKPETRDRVDTLRAADDSRPDELAA
jgi:hypothetical protein